MLCGITMQTVKRTTVRARLLRRTSTDAETHLWFLLRGKRLGGLKFRRQHPVGPFFVDFACPAQRVAIELDGGGHVEPEVEAHDLSRSESLQARGWRVLRFWNDDALFHEEVVVEAIAAAVRSNPSP